MSSTLSRLDPATLACGRRGLLCFSVAVAVAGAGRAQGGPIPLETTDAHRLIVGFVDGTADTVRDACHGSASARLVRRFRHLTSLEVVDVPQGASVTAAVRSYAADPSIRYVAPDTPGEAVGRVSRIESAAPWTPFLPTGGLPTVGPRLPLAVNDPLFPLQWHLENDGSNLSLLPGLDPYIRSRYPLLDPPITAAGQPDLDINATSAWDFTTGSRDVVIAILDTGWLREAPWPVELGALRTNFWVNSLEVPGDGLDNDGNGYVDDVHGIDAAHGTGDPTDYAGVGHGSFVVGEPLGLPGNDGLDGSGVMHEVSMLMCKVAEAHNGWSVADVVAAFDYLIGLSRRPVDPVRITAVNCSFSFVANAAFQDAFHALRDAGILVINAAGNSGVDHDTGGTYRIDHQMVPNINVLTVGGHLHDSARPWRASLTSGVVGSDYGDHNVDLLAASDLVFTSMLPSAGPLTPTSFVYWALGTSVAAPLAAGVAGLVAADDPSLAWYQIRNRLIAGAKRDAAARDVTISGGYLRAADVADANGETYGALTVRNRVVTRRIAPLEWFFESGVRSQSLPITLKVLNLLGGDPGGPVSVRVFRDGREMPPVELYDDGRHGDEVAGDGVYSCDFHAAGEGHYELRFPDDRGIPDVLPFDVYRAERLKPRILGEFEWLEPSAGDTVLFVTPFRGSSSGWLGVADAVTQPIVAVGGTPAGYRHRAWSVNGGILLGHLGAMNFHSADDNTGLPVPFSRVYPAEFLNANVLLAPFWDDLAGFADSSGAAQSTCTTFVTGSAPHRELVMTFQNLTHASMLGRFDPDAPGDATITFQVVFREGGDSVSFNYADVTFGDPAIDGGASATVGIQVGEQQYWEFSVDRPSLHDRMSIRWSTDRGHR